MNRIFAIGDLHLSFSGEKPMDVFGEAWRDHTGRLARAWEETVDEEDLVLIPGDISWAMQLYGASPDLAFIGALPGKKLLLKGNHDYWWNSVTQVRRALSPNTFALQNDAFLFGGYAVCGTRGWSCPGSAAFTAGDEKIYQREAQRLSLSLAAAPMEAEKLVMTHFPPFNEKRQDSAFTALLESAGVKTALYAHLHGPAHRTAFNGERNGVTYQCVSSDYLGFVPKQIR